MLRNPYTEHVSNDHIVIKVGAKRAFILRIKKTVAIPAAINEEGKVDEFHSTRFY